MCHAKPHSNAGFESCDVPLFLLCVGGFQRKCLSTAQPTRYSDPSTGCIQDSRVKSPGLTEWLNRICRYQDLNPLNYKGPSTSATSNLAVIGTVGRMSEMYI